MTPLVNPAQRGIPTSAMLRFTIADIARQDRRCCGRSTAKAVSGLLRRDLQGGAFTFGRWANKPCGSGGLGAKQEEKEVLHGWGRVESLQINTFFVDEMER